MTSLYNEPNLQARFKLAYKNEINNNLPMESLNWLLKLSLFKLNKTVGFTPSKLNTYVIREVFKYDGDIKVWMHKTNVYNKLKVIKYLLNNFNYQLVSFDKLDEQLDQMALQLLKPYNNYTYLLNLANKAASGNGDKAGVKAGVKAGEKGGEQAGVKAGVKTDEKAESIDDLMIKLSNKLDNLIASDEEKARNELIKINNRLSIYASLLIRVKTNTNPSQNIKVKKNVQHLEVA